MSSGGEVSVRFTSTEEAALWQSFAKLVNAGKNAGAQLENTSGKAVKLSGSLAAFAREIQRIPTAPVDTLATKLQKVQDLLAKKVITPEMAKAAEAKFAAEDSAAKKAQADSQAAMQKKIADEAAAANLKVLQAQAASSKRIADAEAKAREERLAPLRRFADEQVKLDATPVERAQAAWHKLREAVAAGLMTEQQFVRASSRVHAEYAATIEKAAEAQRKAAQARVPAGPDPMAPDPASLAAWNEQVRATKQADAELQSFVERVKKLDETPAQRLAAQMGRLDQALSRGKLSQDEYGRAAKRAQDTYQDELRQSEEGQRRVNQSTASAGQSVSQFAEGMAGRLVGLFSVARAATAIFQEMKQAADDAGRSVQTSREGLGALAQFDPSQFAGLQQQARDLRAQGAADSIDAAAKMLFAMRSAGAEKGDVATFAQMSKFGLVSDAAGMARSASALQTALGKDQAGTFTDIVGRALTASKYTPATAEQLVQGAAKAGSFARTQGVGAESLLAGTAILSSAKGSAEEGGSRLAALLRQTSLNKQFRGMDLPQLVDSIEARKLSPERLKKLLGDSEAIDAFQILSQQRDQLRTALADFASNRGRDPIAERLRMAQSDASIAAAARLREAEGRLEVARVPLGVQRTELATRIATGKANIEQANTNALFKGIGGAALSTSEAIYAAAPEFANRATDVQQRPRTFMSGLTFGGNVGMGFTPQTQAGPQREQSRRDSIRDEAAIREQREAVRQMREAAEAQKRAAQALSDAVQPRARYDRWGPSAQAQHSRAAE